MKNILNRLIYNQIAHLVFFSIFTVIIMGLLKPTQFLNIYNLESILFSSPELGLLSLSIMVTMLCGGIDLSVIAIANFCAIISGKLFVLLKGAEIPIELQLIIVIIAVMMIAFIAGIFNGYLITKLKITPILATLGSSQLIMGIGVVITSGAAIVGFPEVWSFIGSEYILGIPLPFFILIIVSFVANFILTKTAFGIHLVLIGSSPKVAIFSGIKHNKSIFLSYIMSAFMAAIAGIIMCSRANSAKADYGSSYLLQAILIAVLGGTNPSGGKGSVVGVITAVITLMVISSGLRMMRVSDFFIDVIWGVFLLLVMVLNYYNEKRSSYL